MSYEFYAMVEELVEYAEYEREVEAIEEIEEAEEVCRETHVGTRRFYFKTK